MKKYARLFSVIALILAITFVFSGCGVIDFAKSILTKTEDTTAPSDTTVVNDVVYDNNAVTDSALIAPPSDTVSDTQGTTSPAVSTTAGAVADTTEATKSNSSTTSTGNKTPTTTVPSTTESITVEDIEEMPLKDIQDLLFTTQDAEVAKQILNAFGFEYDEKQGIYYSSIDPWQKNFGFNYIYDMAAPMTGMYYDTERVQFEYDGKDWMIQLWKGQYGITSGAEIGIYNKTDKIIQYECVSEEEFLEMSFDFYNQGEYVFSRGPEKHWWLTGFKIFNAGVPILIDLDITIKFPTKSMADAFETGLKNAARDNLLDPMTYTRSAKTFHIHW